MRPRYSPVAEIPRQFVNRRLSLWGDAFGHIHQEIVNDNHDPDNTGPVLYADISVPLVALALYIARERLRRE